MKIFLKRNYGYELIFEAENVKVVEDIEDRIYSKTEDGKIYNVLDKRINPDPDNNVLCYDIEGLGLKYHIRFKPVDDDWVDGLLESVIKENELILD